MYPKENEWLFHSILLNGGCIITEYEASIAPNTKNFPKRNRIISGIAIGVLVVEAEYRSGSTITANYAKEQGKTIYAIPSNIDTSTGIGTNKLLQNGAMLITKPSQIQKDFISKGHNQHSHQNSSKEFSSKQISFSLESKIPQQYQEVYRLLEKEPIHINEITKKSQYSISELNGILTMMEIEGYIQRLASNLYKRKE